MEPAADFDQPSMTFGEHLEELRRRLIMGLLGVAVMAAVTLTFGRELVAWLCVPLTQAQRDAGLPAQTYFFNPAASFTVYLKVSLIAAAILASPWLLYQVWLFVAAGLYASERRVVALLAPLSTAMTGLGLAFAYYIMLPLTLMFFIGFAASFPEPGVRQPTVVERIGRLTSGQDRPEAGRVESAVGSRIDVVEQDPADPSEGQMWLKLPEGELRLSVQGRLRRVPLTSRSLVSPLIDLSEYVGFASLVTLGIVVAFQLPVVMVILAWARAVRPEQVAQVRKYCIFGCFIVSAILTPTDVVSMVVLSLPLVALFEVGLLLMRIAYGREQEPGADGQG